MKAIFASRGSKAWVIVTAILLVLLITINILTTSVFYNLLNTVMPGGGERPIYSGNAASLFTLDDGYSNKTEALATANEVNVRICEEGFVLLKNKDSALPISTDPQAPKISVFGKNSVDIAYGGSGSGGVNAEGAVSLYDSLEAAGFVINPTLRSFYEDTNASGPKRQANSSNLDDGDSVPIATAETPQSSYTDAVKASYSEYSDAAIVVFTRVGGEGFDLPRYQGSTEGAASPDDHYLQLDRNERDLLTAVCDAGFDKVIVVINSGAAMELTFLEDSEYFAGAGKIDAAIWMGFPGTSGALALGRILNGTVNPSGSTVDTYASNLKLAPSFQNVGDNNFGDTGRSGSNWVTNDQYMLDGTTPQAFYFTDYEEGIYVGYKYYETRAASYNGPIAAIGEKNYANGEEWYRDNVVYPFGYGLSYTTFSWSVANRDDIAFSGNDPVVIKVDVTNTGSAAGRDVVQVYVTPPYTPGGIEKSHKVLAGFAKTEVLKPGETQTIEITFHPYDIASYDYSDANRNGFKGYELEAGDYVVCVSKNAHEVVDSVTCRIADGATFALDPVTGYTVVNRYTDQDNEYFNSDTHLGTVLSRNDWANTWPQKPALSDRTVDSAFVAAMNDTSHNNPSDFGSMYMPWFDEPAGMTFSDMLPTDIANLPLDGSPIVSYEDDRWQTLLEQCSFAELQNMYNYGAFQTAALPTINKPATLETDGPVGFVNFMDVTHSTYFGTCNYCCEVVIASTWNVDRARDFGTSVGNEGLLGNSNTNTPYSGWYAPGVNIHRSPFGGRNFEYLSEDGVLAGKLAAQIVIGAQSKGVYCYMKHFALNEQETHRSINGDCSWVTEQAMREIYLKPFEIAVKEGGTRAIMSSFNRIGTRWTGGDYRLLTEILRNEWGFRGTVICDFNTNEYMNSRQMAYAGGDLNLATLPVSWSDENDQADTIVLMQAAKNVLYTVVNSNSKEVVGYAMPIWEISLFVLDGVIAAALAVWGFFAIRGALKKSGQKK